MDFARLIVAGLASVLLAGPAAAGTVITMTVTGQGSAKPETHRMLIGERHVRMEFDGGAAVYDGRTDVLRVDDHGAKTYFEMTAETMAAVQGQIGQMPDMQAMMREQLAGLPDDQRRQIEAMLSRQQQAMPAVPKSVVYRKSGASARVGKWSCDNYERLADGQKTAELCLAGAGALSIPAADLETLARMSRRMARQPAGGRTTAGAMAELDYDALVKAAGQATFPIRTVEFHGGRPSVTSTVTDIERRDLPASLFAVPAGYTQERLPGMGR
jgi:Domain of unknown function (DUF4412)